MTIINYIVGIFTLLIKSISPVCIHVADCLCILADTNIRRIFDKNITYKLQPTLIEMKSK